jgi:hypothetical protein
MHLIVCMCHCMHMIVSMCDCMHVIVCMGDCMHSLSSSVSWSSVGRPTHGGGVKEALPHALPASSDSPARMDGGAGVHV